MVSPNGEIELSLAILFRSLWAVSKAEAVLRFGVNKGQVECILAFSESELMKMAMQGVQRIAVGSANPRPKIELVA